MHTRTMRLLVALLMLLGLAGLSLSADEARAIGMDKARTVSQKQSATSKVIKATNMQECEKRCDKTMKGCMKKADKAQQKNCEYYRDQCKDRCRRNAAR